MAERTRSRIRPRDPVVILAIDQGTTGTRAVVVDLEGRFVSSAYQEFPQIFPQPGWVSHDACGIWSSTTDVIDLALKETNGNPILGVGIANQRETTLLWDRRTGEPVHDAIVWQCRRTADVCRAFREEGLSDAISAKTGLVIDPYFSATKIIWLLDNDEGLRERAEAGDICFGTMDSYLLYKLTGGKVHSTDITNASRTMIFNIHDRSWDDELCDRFRIPRELLPEVHPSAHVFGHTVAVGSLAPNIPIAGIAGDQQAALYGQRGVSVGDIKNTYGTGCFTLFQTGDRPVASNQGLLTTISCDAAGAPNYALEGSVFSAGSAVQWLRDGLGIITTASETENLARSVSDTGGVYLVPAFTGLGAPHWDPDARGTLVGITRGTERPHIVRAALESIAYQSTDLVNTMSADAGDPVTTLRVDGGASANNFLMQFQADLLDVPVVRPRNTETTAVGAAALAGLTTGFWTEADLSDLNPPDRTFEPGAGRHRRDEWMDGWHRAVEASRHHGQL